MTARLLTAAALLVMASRSMGESLDVGGVEFQLGQNADHALRRLSPYKVQYVGGTWLVTQESGGEHQVLGQLEAKENRLTLIRKSYQMRAPEDAPQAYTLASRELRHLGGNKCVTREVTFTDGLIRAFETQCGNYTLHYSMPGKFDGGVKVMGAVEITTKSSPVSED